MTNYLLAKHVYLCVRGSDVIFLDLKQDKYLAMNASKVSRVLQLPPKNPLAEEFKASTPPPTEAERKKTADALCRKGLLTTEPEKGKQPELPAIDEPQADLLGPEAATRPAPLSPLAIARFLGATLYCWLALRFFPLERVVKRVRTRREKHVDSAALDLDRAAQCVAVLERMRPYLFSAKDACLFESLVLLEFLSRYGLYPRWVFGVQTLPFGAHCWVQHANIVFNDSPEHACEFTPIMVV
jgi:hypothetical protein